MRVVNGERAGAFSGEGLMSEEVVEDIKREEGFASRVYLDTGGRKTIGYGTLLEDGISEAEAVLLLHHRLGAMAEELAHSRVGGVCAHLTRGARRAVLNMAYNMGVPNLLGFERMWTALAEGDYERAAAEVLDSEYARALPARARRVAAVMRSV